MTVVNASNSTEAFRLTPVSNQLAFSSQDPGGLNTATRSTRSSPPVGTTTR